MTRGYRNNNPGNLRKTSTVWVGQVIPGSDDAFMQFTSMELGYRAIFVLLNGYINKGYNTIEKIINRYAPTSENNTSAYVTRAVQISGISKDKVIDFASSHDIVKIVAAISTVENGITPDWTVITAGYNLLGSEVKTAETVKTVGISFVVLTLVASLGFIVYNIIKK
jgi:hypothetical protein